MSIDKVVLVIGSVPARPKDMRIMGAERGVRISYLRWRSNLFPQIPLETVAVILVRPHQNSRSWGRVFDSFVEHVRIKRKLPCNVVESTENFDFDSILTSVLSSSKAV